MFDLLATVLIGALAVATALASAYFFFRARRHEAAAPDPADTIVEMRALGQRIETLVGQQQLQGETARHQMAQKMEAVVEHVNGQRTHVAGLQNELRHEVRRRDAEMEEIRHQLSSIQQMATRTALPPAPTAALPPAAMPAPESPAAEPQPADPPPFEMASFEPPVEAPAPESNEATSFEPATFAPAAFEAVPAAAPAMGDGFAATFSEDGWDVGVPTVAAPTSAPPPVASSPAAEPAADEVRPFATADPFAVDAPAPALAPAAFDSAPGFTFEDLTPEEPTTPEPPTFETPAFDAPTFEAPVFQTPAFETPAFETPAFQAPAFAVPAFSPAMPTAAPATTAAPAPPSETAWVARADRPEPTAGFPTFDVPSFEAATFEAPAPASAPALEPDPAAPFVAPAGADRLTVISSVDEPMQQALYMAGVTTLDEIARWSRTDARRISSVVAVSEDTILNQWVFEAQAALFQSFSTTQR